MSNFFVALYAVLPMFIMLAIGFTVRKMKVIEEAHLPVLNKIVFNVFFPFLMFNNIYAFDLSADFNASLLLYAVVAVAVIYGLSVGFALIFEKSNKSRGALIQAIYRSNFGTCVGVTVGLAIGISVGFTLGVTFGFTVGLILGSCVGTKLGSSLSFSPIPDTTK